MDDEIRERLARIEEKQDKWFETFWAHINNDTRNFERLDGRINELANDQMWFKRIASGVVAFIGAVITWSVGRK